MQPDFAPDRYESGTLNSLGIVGLGAAAEHLLETGVDRVHRRLLELGTRFRDALADIDGVVMNGPADPARGFGILSLNVEGIPCATVSRYLDAEWGGDDPRRPPLLACGAPEPGHGARRDGAALLEWEQEPQVERALTEAEVRYEAIHRYDVEDAA